MVEKKVIKRSLSGKIFLIFFSSLIIIFCAIIIILALSLNMIATQETYYRLDNYTRLTVDYWQKGIPIIDDNVGINRPEIWGTTSSLSVIQGKVKDKPICMSYYLETNVLETSELDTFLNKIEIGNNSYEAKNGTIYYCFRVDEKTKNFVVFLVDDTYNEGFIRNVIFNIIIVITIATILLAFILGFFINKMINRIKALQSHISNMTKDNYNVGYIDDGDDEIRELSDSIEQMRIEIKNSENIKQEMLQNVSHDFKTPIAVIKNYGEAILDGVCDKEDAKIIVKQADVLKLKVNQLLQYNRLEYLNKDKPFSEVDICDVIKEVVNNHNVNDNKIKFILNLEPCVFLGYRENFTTIVENIVDNAIRYAKSKIIITTKENKLTIYNDGEAIEDKFLKANFKPYEKGSKGEFGLGMSIVQKTVNFFDLKLKVYNEKQGGVSFVIYKE